jgi:chitin disaccharide deacetylase
MKKLIINADDFGYDRDTFETTCALLALGTVKSATILVGFPETQAAINFARSTCQDISFGLHFNIAEGRPLSTRPVPSLVNQSGEFNGAIVQRLKAVSGRVSAIDVATECEAQLSILRDNGLAVSHIDSHGHFHKFPAVLNAMAPVLKRFGVARIRRAQTLYDNPTFYNRTLDAYCNRAIDKFGGAPDHFFNTRTHIPDWLQNIVERVPHGLTEIGIHPGSVEAWRNAETKPFLNAEACTWIESRAISAMSFHDVPV